MVDAQLQLSLMQFTGNAEEVQSPAPKQHAILRQQGVEPQLVSQQALMQHSGQVPQPEVVAAVGRGDANEPIEVNQMAYLQMVLWNLNRLTVSHKLVRPG